MTKCIPQSSPELLSIKNPFSLYVTLQLDRDLYLDPGGVGGVKKAKGRGRGDEGRIGE